MFLTFDLFLQKAIDKLSIAIKNSLVSIIQIILTDYTHMDTEFTTPKVEELFSDYLTRIGISGKTFKNYRSDVAHFTGWIIFRVRTFGVSVQELTEAIPFLSDGLAREYKTYLVENNVSSKTVNRRLSTLRHLGRFLLESQILDFDFMNGLQNITLSENVKPDHGKLISGFQKHLEGQNVSRNTVKNYVSDIRQFLYWLEQKSLTTHG